MTVTLNDSERDLIQEMLDTLMERRVARFTELDGSLIVDTCRVLDSDPPYETAVSHVAFNRGGWIIVETYNTPEEAVQGHQQWIDTMSGPTSELPDALTDVTNSSILKRAEAVLGPRQHEFPRAPWHETKTRKPWWRWWRQLFH